ncbi:MAG: hypothetical protein RLW62_09425, partial [Gammaproteobacteria bacterium]
MPVSRPSPCAWLVAALLALCALAAPADDDAMRARPLVGVNRIEVSVTGVPDDFARYGLTAAELHARVAAGLAGHGIEIVD